ncbi:MAG: hypothetical protein NVSMB4_03250 [Acidimicrobiales bacterium]
MASQWPLVVSRMVTLLKGLPAWSNVAVYDGPPVTGDIPNQWCTVGYVEDDKAGNYVGTQHDDGFSRHETGEVRCQLACNTGDDDLPGMRTQLFGLLDAVDAAVRADRRLGVLSPEGTSTFSVEVESFKSAHGTAQVAVFALHYTTVT